MSGARLELGDELTVQRARTGTAAARSVPFQRGESSRTCVQCACKGGGCHFLGFIPWVSFLGFHFLGFLGLVLLALPSPHVE